MTKDELMRALVAESGRLQSLRAAAREAGRPDVAAEISKAGEKLADAVGKLCVQRRGVAS